MRDPLGMSLSPPFSRPSCPYRDTYLLFVVVEGYEDVLTTGLLFSLHPCPLEERSVVGVNRT